MSDSQWAVVRIPAPLADRIARLGEEMMLAHIRGQARLPSEYCERIPPHHVIDRAITEMEAHRKRSRSKPKPSADGEM